MKNNIEQYKILHSQGKYGVSSEKLYDDILPLVCELNPHSILDYGCGQSKLIDMLPIPKKYRYDPAIEKYNSYPESATVIDLVTCIDVLEHIPENELEHTLKVIRSFSENAIFDIGTQLAHHILPNGENSHCTVKSIEWWMAKLKRVFPNVTFVKNIRNVKFMCKTWE